MATTRTKPIDLNSALKVSAIAHLALMIYFVLQNLFWPGTPEPYIPALRVDLVALPDLLKSEKMNLAAIPEIQDTAPPKKVEVEKEERADPKDMVLKPKKVTEKVEDRSKKLQNSLARIKSLSKILNEEASTPTPSIIKGNKVSKGTSLSGDAREAERMSYLDLVRDRLLEKWSLPVWLARQNLSAKVRISIDEKGGLRDFSFLKLSGNEQFDDAVKRTVAESQPFPRPSAEAQNSGQTDGIIIGFPL